MAQTWYVNTDNAGSEDGTTVNTGYKTLNGALQAKAGTLSTPTTFDCRGSAADTTPVDLLNQYVTDATNYLEIKVAQANRHDGKWNTGKYRIVVTNSRAINSNVSFLRLDGLQVQTSAVNGAGQHACYLSPVSSSGDVRVSNCLVRGATDGTTPHRGIYIVNGGASVYVWNTVVYGFSTISNAGPVFVDGTAGTTYLYNVVGRHGETGAWNSGSGTCAVVAKNTYFADSGFGTSDFYGTITKTNCASADTSAGALNGCISSLACNTTQFVNVTAGSEDFHLAGTGSGLYGVGADNTGDSSPLNYTTDIDGHTIGTGRATFDIGADWYYVAATGQFARPSSDVAGGTFRSILVTAPFGPRVIA